MIRAVTFDLWNTLLENKDFTELRIRSLRRALGDEGVYLPDSVLMGAYSSASEKYRRSWEQDHTHLSVDERVEHILTGLGMPNASDVKRTVIESFTHAFVVDPPALKEGVEETLEALKGEYSMGIISDTGVTPGSIIREYLDGCGLLRYFASTVFSDEVGYCKPDIRVFKKALQELKAGPEEAVHVGDLLRTDVAGAKHMGMKAVWVSGTTDLPTEEPVPDFVINSLPKLLDVIRDM